MSGSKLLACALLFTLCFAAENLTSVRAQDQEGLTPYPGERASEFEARRKGLSRPAGADASTVMLVADARGHFGVEPAINGMRVHMMVDTGASSVVLTEKDAQMIGISPPPRDYSVQMATANGVVLVAPTVLQEVAVGGIVLRDVRAVVVPQDRLTVSLLGMSFLSRLTRVEVSAGRLILTR